MFHEQNVDAFESLANNTRDGTYGGSSSTSSLIREGDLALKIEFRNCHSGMMPMFVRLQVPMKSLGCLYFVS